jgi:putative hydrolase of the HAD superfamily
MMTSRSDIVCVLAAGRTHDTREELAAKVPTRELAARRRGFDPAARARAPHLHAELSRFDGNDDATSARLQLEMFGDLLAEPLLELRAAGEVLEDAPERADPDDIAPRKIPDVRPPEKWEEMVGAQRVEWQLARDYQTLAVAFVSKRLERRWFADPRRQFARQLGDALRRPGDFRVLRGIEPEEGENFPHVPGDARDPDLAFISHGETLPRKPVADHRPSCGCWRRGERPDYSSAVQHTVLFFDVGGTLLHLRPSLAAALSATCGDLGICVEGPDAEWAIERATARVGPGPHAVDLGENRRWWFAFYRAYLDSLGHARAFDTVAPEMWRRHRAGDWLVPAPDATSTLETLARAGHSMGVISNWDDTLSAILARHGLLRFFDVVVASAQVGFAKPDRRIFELALSMAGVAPADAFHVGDDAYTDVQGALDAGLRPIFIGPRMSLPRTTQVIGALAELPAIVDSARSA